MSYGNVGPVNFSLVSLITMRYDKRQPIGYQSVDGYGLKRLTWEEAVQVVKNVFDVVVGVAVEDAQKQNVPKKTPVQPVNQKRLHLDEKNTPVKLYAHNHGIMEPEYKLWFQLTDEWLESRKNHDLYYRINDLRIVGVKQSIDLPGPSVHTPWDPVLANALQKEHPQNIRSIKIDERGRMYVPKLFGPGPLIETKHIKEVKEVKEIKSVLTTKSKAEEVPKPKAVDKPKSQKELTCYTCGEQKHVSKMCDWYKTQKCVFFDSQNGCSFGERCRNAHDAKEIRAFCDRCQVTHQIDQHVHEEEEEEVLPCKACQSVDHQYDQCPEMYCRTCKNNNHWSSNCFKCGQCGEFKHVSANCPYMKKFTGNKFA